ncbi:MAG TPA: nickel-dependent hydrogenase large subunit [Feifaniaceae bacterium]|nr:nickel-dependent hydrogenase large subunit [Feifaniaceae bacterium]
MGKIVVPFGPQHPALEEPESFSLLLEGERVAAASVALGYNHRGMEKACESKTFVQNIYLLERICGICSHAHSTCYVETVESLLGLEVPRRAQYLRSMVGELERIHSHLLFLGVAGHEIGFMTFFMYAWKDREIVMDLLENITGNRINYGMNTIGGVRRDITPEQIDIVKKGMDELEERTKYYMQVAIEEETMLLRLRGVGRLSREDALRFGAQGPVLRASGVARDIRRDDPYDAYPELAFKVATDDHADVYGRVIVRVLELMESYKLIRQIVNNLPEGPISVKAPVKIPEGEAVSRVEAPRGENVHYVRSNGTDKPERVKVRAPTLGNLAAITHMIEGGYLADVPIVIAAIDPCFSCTDRAIKVVNFSSGEDRRMDWQALRQYSIDWYRKQGVNMEKISAHRKDL